MSRDSHCPTMSINIEARRTIRQIRDTMVAAETNQTSRTDQQAAQISPARIHYVSSLAAQSHAPPSSVTPSFFDTVSALHINATPSFASLNLGLDDDEDPIEDSPGDRQPGQDGEPNNSDGEELPELDVVD
jgi:hypothetical protein